MKKDMSAAASLHQHERRVTLLSTLISGKGWKMWEDKCDKTCIHRIEITS